MSSETLNAENEIQILGVVYLLMSCPWLVVNPGSIYIVNNIGLRTTSSNWSPVATIVVLFQLKLAYDDYMFKDYGLLVTNL